LAATRIETLLSRAEQAIAAAGEQVGSPAQLVELLQRRAHSVASGLTAAEVAPGRADRPNLSDLTQSNSPTGHPPLQGPHAVDYSLS
jgi:hypothetical protein